MKADQEMSQTWRSPRARQRPRNCFLQSVPVAAATSRPPIQTAKTGKERFWSIWVARCEELRLYLDRPPEPNKLEATVLLSVQTMNYLHAVYHRVVL